MSTFKNQIRRLIKGSSYIDACDEYINWLLISNAGMQHKGNVHCFELAISELPGEHPVLEIGAHAGLSANIINWLLHKHNRTNTIVSVDPWLVRGYHDEHPPDANYLKQLAANPEITREAYAEFIRESYIRNVRFFSSGREIYAFRMFSDAFFEAWPQQKILTDELGRSYTTGNQFGFVYIDGNHDYDYCRRDFENADKFLAPGGFILFDDSEDGSSLGSAQFAAELERDKRYKLRAKNPNRLFQKLK
ncbi:MAG: class I SAM-dependent methyltransferase [Bacteroidia bacterium]